MLMRRVILAVVIAMAGLAPAFAAERVVHVYNWSDYIDPKVIEDFTKDTGIQVVYDTFDSNDVLETKLLAGKTGYDVEVPSASYLQRLVGVGVFLKLDKAKIPNLKYLWPEIAARRPCRTSPPWPRRVTPVMKQTVGTASSRPPARRARLSKS